MDKDKYFETAVKGTKIVIEKLLDDIDTISLVSAEKHDIDFNTIRSILGSAITHLLIENKIAIVNNPKNEE